MTPVAISQFHRRFQEKYDEFHVEIWHQRTPHARR